MATRVARARKAAGLSQAELGAAVGVTQTAVSYWEGGSREPSLEKLVAIAQACRVPITALLPGSDVVPAVGVEGGPGVTPERMYRLERQVRTLRQEHYDLVDRLTADGLLAPVA